MKKFERLALVLRHRGMERRTPALGRSCLALTSKGARQRRTGQNHCVKVLASLILSTALGLPVGCQSDTPSRLNTDTETNWLKSCDGDGECGGYSCECGVCTTVCETASQCSMPGAVCRRAGDGEHDALCRDATDGAGLCLEANPEMDDDPLEVTPSADDAGPLATGGAPDPGEPEATPEPASSGSDPEPGGEPEPAAPLPAPGNVDSGLSVPGPEVDAFPDDAGGTPPQSDDAGLSPAGCSALDRETLPEGCCYDENDCADGQRCYQAQCDETAPIVGRCALPPAGSCFDDRDCGSDEQCNGGQLAACGSLAPDGLGSCEPVTSDLLQGYLLWDRPGGAAGTGPAIELVEDGTLRLWQQTTPFTPRETSDADFETELSPEQADEIVRLLSAVDYANLPHETTFIECYPRIYFEGPDGQLVDIEYGGAAGLLPEMQDVYDWFDTRLAELAPEFVGPSQYCPELP